MSSCVAAPDATPKKHASFSLLIALGIAVGSFACGTSNMQNTTATTPPPTQPSYPSTPPVAITWEPNTSPYPAPPACSPPTSTCAAPDSPTGSNDFPLTVSSPTDGGTVISPAMVVASASPTNPIFFMRVYVDQLAVYFTFTNSINTQLFIAPGQHTIEVMAEDNQGYISATPMNVTISSQTAQTTISNIQSMPGW